jgi:hypothetical protein
MVKETKTYEVWMHIKLRSHNTEMGHQVEASSEEEARDLIHKRIAERYLGGYIIRINEV